MPRKQTLGSSPAAEHLTDYKLGQLCRDWARLEDERLDFESKTSARAKAQREIRQQLEDELRLRKTSRIELAKFEIGFELVEQTLRYKDALVAEIGLEELERRVDELPLKEEFYLREKAARAASRRGAA